ncbi:MAG: hypothetical protein WC637_20625, partial [Victivallales bacterium]
MNMKKVPQDELFILRESNLDRSILSSLIDFNRKYQQRILRYFAEIRIEFENKHPGVTYPGLFAEMDSISGEMRPLEAQKVWSWGDCRGLGIWSYLATKKSISDTEIEIRGRKINPSVFFSDYCDSIYKRLIERYEINGGRIPFIVDVMTNRASVDPANVPCDAGECEPTHVFAAAGFMQYGLMRKCPESLELGLKFLDESIDCGMNFRNVDHITKKRNPYNGHGFIMVTLGAIVDILKCLKHSEIDSLRKSELETMLLKNGFVISNFILHNFCNPDTGHFWEYNSKDGTPYVNPDGYMICDPGHVSEACGFIAEMEDLSDKFKAEFSPKLVKIMCYIYENGYSSSGLMYKNLDILSSKGIYDRTDSSGIKYRTSTWW